MDYTADEEKEIRRNHTGRLVLIASILLLLLACFGFNGGTAAAVIGEIGTLGFIIGFFLAMGNKSKSEIDADNRLAKQQAALMLQMAKSGASSKEISDTILGMDTAGQSRNSGTKEIIKGAVIGGIVAGDAGAVVGATIAKNKLDSKRK